MLQRPCGSQCRHVVAEVALDLAFSLCESTVNMMEKVEMTGCWHVHSQTTLFMLIPKNVTSERPVAVLPTFYWVVVVAEGPCFLGVERKIITWNVALQYAGGAERTLWEVLSELRKLLSQCLGGEPAAAP